MTSERSKRRDLLSLIFISKSISKKLLIKNIFFQFIFCILPAKVKTVVKSQPLGHRVRLQTPLRI